jgi:integrase
LAKLLNAHRGDVTYFARFLAYSGARLSEAGAMTWEHLHGDTMTIPGTKTNTSRNHIVPVMRAAEDLFSRMRKDRTERGKKCEGPMFVDETWERIRQGKRRTLLTVAIMPR